MLEVRLLYKKLENYTKVLEQTVQERTAELRESEARYRSLTELASDWYWEQDETGNFTKVSGPVLDMLGIRVEPLAGEASADGMSAGTRRSDRRFRQGLPNGSRSSTSHSAASMQTARDSESVSAASRCSTAPAASSATAASALKSRPGDSAQSHCRIAMTSLPGHDQNQLLAVLPTAEFERLLPIWKP